jgi:hypothetical protein
MFVSGVMDALAFWDIRFLSRFAASRSFFSYRSERRARGSSARATERRAADRCATGLLAAIDVASQLVWSSQSSKTVTSATTRRDRIAQPLAVRPSARKMMSLKSAPAYL